MDFKTTDAYNRIKSDSTDKIFPIPYYLKTSLIVTEDNFPYVVDLEEMKYKEKMDSVQAEHEFPNFNLREKIEERIRPFIGSNLLELKYSYFNSSNIDIGYKEIESDENFNNWLIK
jgi:hypothetical protein